LKSLYSGWLNMSMYIVGVPYNAVHFSSCTALRAARASNAGAAVGPGIPDLPRSEQARIGELAGRTRPGDNANAAAVAELDDVERWLRDHRGSPEAQTVERLLDAVGAAAARGAAWVA